MTWIKTVPYDDATGRLKMLYDRIKATEKSGAANVDNIMMAHSLRPHSMDGHMTLYKYVLHHTGNTVPKWFLEAIGVLVSHLNGCAYCFDHHWTGMARLLGDVPKAEAIRAAVVSGDLASVFDAAQVAALTYARKLTEAPAGMTQADIAPMRSAGWDDGQILEINQVTAYFAYANRTVQGLGVTTDGDILGLSPNNSDDPDDWSHT